MLVNTEERKKFCKYWKDFSNSSERRKFENLPRITHEDLRKCNVDRLADKLTKGK